MFGRQTSGSVLCRSCGRLVGVRDGECFECGARYPGLWGFSPLLRRFGEDLGFAPLLLGICILLYGGALMLDPGGITNRGFGVFAPSHAALRQLGSAGVVPVFLEGRWWTLLSAGWLHGSLLHIFFNLYWVTYLVPQVAHLYGPGRTVILYTVSSLAGFALSSLGPVLVAWVAPPLLPVAELVMRGVSGFTVGASAALMGLWGALVFYSRRSGSRAMSQWAWSSAALIFVSGFFFRGTDNWAHLGGFLGGWLCARVLDPLKPERTNHLVAGLICLVVSLAAVAYSFFSGSPTAPR